MVFDFKLLYRIPYKLLQQLLVVTTLLPLGMLLIPIGLLLRLNDTRTTDCEDQRLPKWLKWFDVGDEKDRKYGLNGDLGYQAGFRFSLLAKNIQKILTEEKRKPAIISNLILKIESGEISTLSKWELFKSRYTWLALRNPVNYFKYAVLGYKIKGTEQYSIYHRQSNNGLEVSDWSNGESGSFYCELDTGVWEYYVVYQYPFNKDKCFRFRVGYKIGQDFEERLESKNTRSIISFACALQPWKTYRGL